MFAAPGLPELVLDGLEAEAASELLSASAPTAAPATRALLLEQAVGNPLALVELPSGLTEAELEGISELPESVSLTERLLSAFARRSLGLSADTRSALLILALADDGDASAVIRAIAEAGLPEDALDAAEQAGLLGVAGDRLAFRHPLIRTAIHQRATLTDRRRAHASLAAALSGDLHHDRRVWHQALATMTRDEGVAAALAASAARSLARGAHASAAAAFVRAAQLTPDADRRASRHAAAARAAWAAGAPDRASALIVQALPLAAGRPRIELLHLRGVIEARTGDVRDAIATLLGAADASDDGSLTLEILIEAMEAAIWAGDYPQAVTLGARAAAIEPRTETDRFRADTLIGLAATLSGDHRRGGALLRSASKRAERLDDPHQLIWAARTATIAGAAGDGSSQAARAVAIARERGLLTILPVALQEQSTALVGLGRFSLAYAAAEEAIRLAEDIGQRWGASWNLACLASLDALRGDEARAREHADQALALASTSGAAFIVGFARRALGRLDLTLGRADAATERLLPLTAADGPGSNPVIALWSIPDLIEAASRCGRTEEVKSQFERYVNWAQQPPSPARSAVLARLRALMQDGDVRLRFEEAVGYGDAVSPFQRARTELLFGEWLRRVREPRESRNHLRVASELFRQVGTRPWEDRAESELRATGETARRRDPSTLDDLTPQELQIAGLVAAGMTNRQIAEQLYLSPRTIDYHLRKVFMKLRLASRTELVRMGVRQLEAV